MVNAIFCLLLSNLWRPFSCHCLAYYIKMCSVLIIIAIQVNSNQSDHNKRCLLYLMKLFKVKLIDIKSSFKKFFKVEMIYTMSSFKKLDLVELIYFVSSFKIFYIFLMIYLMSSFEKVNIKNFCKFVGGQLDDVVSSLHLDRSKSK